MRVELTGRHVAVSPGLRRLVDRKLARVLRQVNDSGISAQVVVTKQKFQKVVEITLHARGERFLHAVAQAETWELAVNSAAEKIEQQARKMKGKWRERQRRGAGPKETRPREAAARQAAAAEDAPRRRIVRAARYSVRPMTVDEAALELEDRAEPFIVFRDAGSDVVNVLYRRKDGHFALIEPDA
ncbi:MAG: ribosome-associated translation inhibitor RaiA [Acidobacteriota bacterium]